MAVDKMEFDTSGDDTDQDQNGGDDLILGKFKSQEDLVKAYQALENKQSGASDADGDDTESKPEGSKVQIKPKSGGDSLLDEQALIDEFSEKGELSDKTYKSLGRKGLSRTMVDNYVRGQMALANQYAGSITEAAGGQENLDGLLEWASDNLEQDEIDDINAIFSGNNLTAAKMTVAGLVARRAGSGDTDDADPNLLEGDTNTKQLGVKPYASQEQMLADMMKKEYKNDPAFRATVAKRAGVSAWAAR